ncbi:MAG TPA: multidrug efflux SMR transporter [Streptosporangiaceae bacterium]|jgi:small multidrug resistance pump
MTWLVLAAAIACEVVATSALKYSEGFSRLIPSIAVVLGYGGAFVLLGIALKMKMPVSVAYAVWAGAGTAAIALIGVVALHEPVTAMKTAGIALIIGGTVLLNLGGAH